MPLELYNAVKDKMKTGDVIGWDGRNILHATIDCFTKGEIGHVSQILRMSEYEGLERRRFHSEATARGILPSPLGTHLKDYTGIVWWYPLKDEWDSKRGEIGERMLALMGRGYDYTTLFKMAVVHPFVDDRELICSEYIQLTLLGKLQGDRVVYDGKVWTPPELLMQDFYLERIKIYENLPEACSTDSGLPYP
jgi:hypothetical protein